MDDFLTNPVLVLGFISWFVAQGTKFLLGQKHMPAIRFTDPGGMPSSHAAVVGAAATVIALRSGTDSDLFGLAVVVAAIVMHDAYRVRWAVGEQARRLNEVLAISTMKDRTPVVVWKGHRIRELMVGLALGVGLSWLLYTLWYA